MKRSKKIYLRLFSILVFLFFTLAVYIHINLQPYNQAPLSIITFDGSNSPYHPSVLYFDNNSLGSGWNGYRYWMVETPYSNVGTYRDRNECPSIHVSNDGVHWTEPEGLINPLVNFGEEGEKNLDYYSDPHLVMRGDTMECWYRLTERHGNWDNRSQVSLRKVYSTDGVHWSDEIIIDQLNENEPNRGLGKAVISPALVRDKGRYRMWYVSNGSVKGQREIAYSESTDGINWSDKQICSLKGPTINVWHIDVQHIDSTYWLIAYDLNNLTLWRSHDGFDFLYIKELLAPCKAYGSFYGNALYRSCLVKTNEDYKLYFSADDGTDTHIGLMCGTTPESMEIISIDDETHSNVWGGIRIFIIEKYKFVRFLYRTYVKKNIQNLFS